MGEELDRYNTAVKRLREAIELADRVQANVSPFLKCCGLTNKTLPDLTFSPEFQAQVSGRPFRISLYRLYSILYLT